MQRPGRNDPCYCGSGKKFKRCCLDRKMPAEISAAISLQLARLQARQQQREKQQGLGREIISTEFKGYRMVAVGSMLLYSKTWKTFHDFLRDYIKGVFGAEWGQAELQKPIEEQHPLIQWHHLLAEYFKANTQSGLEIQSAPMTGAVFAYLHLSYNLYLLAHNVKVQDLLLRRLKNRDQFPGALYESFVAASLIKAGFALELENEADSTSTHCEFTAIAKDSGRRYSIEAKARQPHKPHVGISKQLGHALRKAAKHQRIVFIDVNIPNLLEKRDDILGELARKECDSSVDWVNAPPAYVFVTNHSYIYDLTGSHFEQVGFAHGFKIADFKLDTQFSSLREALKARERHQDMFALLKATREYNEIPVTFDGEIPEFAFSPEGQKNRLLIGCRYLIPTGAGEAEGVLMTATVVESERKVYGVYQLRNGSQTICSNPMTDEELLAYTRQPDSFFGIPLQQGRQAKDPLELYDFFYESYKRSPRDRLLEFMRERPDFEALKDLSDEELLISCCEGWVYGLISKKSQPASPVEAAQAG